MIYIISGELIYFIPLNLIKSKILTTLLKCKYNIKTKIWILKEYKFLPYLNEFIYYEVLFRHEMDNVQNI